MERKWKETNAEAVNDGAHQENPRSNRGDRIHDEIDWNDDTGQENEIVNLFSGVFRFVDRSAVSQSEIHPIVHFVWEEIMNHD